MEDVSKLAILRRSKNMSQVQLASMFPCAPSCVAAWEQKRKFFRRETLRRLCKIFNCTPNDLIEWEEWE